MNENIFFKNLPIFYINLDRSEDRNKYMIDSFKKNKIKIYFRVPAIDGKKLEKKYDNFSLSQQEAALFFSFKKALEMFLETNYEYCAIVEDDVDLDISKKITFNFYDTLKYHHPKPYILQCAPSIQNKDFLSIKMAKRVPSGYEELWGAAFIIIDRSFAIKALDEIFHDGDIHPCGPRSSQKQLDFCIYSHAEAYMWTIFTIKKFDSTINLGRDYIVDKAIDNISSFVKDKKLSIDNVFPKSLST